MWAYRWKYEPSLGSEIHHRSDIAKNLHIWSREWPALRSTYAPNEIWPKLWQMKLFMNENRVIPISKCIVSLICDIFYFASTQMIRYPYYSEINVRTSYQFVSKHNDRQRFWIASMIQFVKNWRYCCQLRRELKAVIHWLLMIPYGRWFSPGTPASAITKTRRHDIAETLLKVMLSTKNQIKMRQI
jgi:hypothetical protein